MSVLFLLLSAGILCAFWLHGFFLPRWVRWHSRDLTIHTYAPHPLFTDPGFTGTATGEALLSLSGKKIKISEPAAMTESENDAPSGAPSEDAASGIVYSSPDGWFISDAAAADITGDGIEEILLLLWKRGHFGGALPFWVERDDPGFSQHLYIFTYQDQTLQPMWMASKMPVDVQEFTITEDGTVCLVTPDGTESFWKWEHWGLKKQEDR